MSGAISVRGLEKTYSGEIKALRGIGFEVEPGTVFGLLGPNGAGKSTTVKILTTLTHADGGEAQVGGFDVMRQPAKVREVIGVVAQKSTADQTATGRENVRLQGQMYGMKGAELERRIDELLGAFKLSDAADRIVNTYSGGMERRLNIATALVNRPQVLFLDEPTTGLDPEVRAEMWEEISSLASEEGMTILLTTHYLEEADRLAERVAIVDRGQVVAEGTPDELKRGLEGDALHIELDVPSGAAPPPEEGVRGALAQVSGLTEIVLDGATLHTRAIDGARAVPGVLGALDAAGIATASVTVARPSLDDVYLRYTGRTMTAAEAESDPAQDGEVAGERSAA
jgi:ABC-2 type transport system ATP-binding protein